MLHSPAQGLQPAVRHTGMSVRVGVWDGTSSFVDGQRTRASHAASKGSGNALRDPKRRVNNQHHSVFFWINCMHAVDHIAASYRGSGVAPWGDEARLNVTFRSAL
jgi:hypothetical protein